MTLVVAESLITRLRRMVSEPNANSYTDEVLADYIRRYPLRDLNGNTAYLYDYTSSGARVQSDNPNWTPTYDLNAVAAEVWEEKAAGKADCFDFQVGNDSFSKSQVGAAYLARARSFRARRSPYTVEREPVPGPNDNDDRSNR